MDNLLNQYYLENEIQKAKQVFREQQEKYDLDNMIALVMHQESYDDMLVIASGSDGTCRASDLYINHQYLFKHFMLYFREEARTILHKIKHYRTSFPRFHRVDEAGHDFGRHCSNINELEIHQFLKDTTLKRYSDRQQKAKN